MSDRINLPGWVVKSVGLVVAIVGLGAPVLTWCSSVDSALVRIETQLGAQEQLIDALIGSHAERLEKVESDVRRLDDRINKISTTH